MVDTAWLSLSDPRLTPARCQSRKTGVKARRDAEDVVRTIWWFNCVQQASGGRTATQLENQLRVSKDGVDGQGERTKLWFKYARGLHVPNRSTVARVEAVYPQTACELHHSLWCALKRDVDGETLERAVLRLDPSVQHVVAACGVSWFGPQGTNSARRRLGRQLAKRCDLHALAALVILARAAIQEDSAAISTWELFLYQSLMTQSHVFAAKGIARPLFELIVERVVNNTPEARRQIDFDVDRYCRLFQSWCETLQRLRKFEPMSDASASSLLLRAATGNTDVELIMRYCPPLIGK